MWAGEELAAGELPPGDSNRGVIHPPSALAAPHSEGAGLLTLLASWVLVECSFQQTSQAFLACSPHGQSGL